MINDVDDTLSIILSFLSPQCSEVCRRWSRINDKQTFAALGMPLCSMCRELPWRDKLIRGVVYYSNMFPMHFGCFNATIASKTSSNAIAEYQAIGMVKEHDWHGQWKRFRAERDEEVLSALNVLVVGAYVFQTNFRTGRFPEFRDAQWPRLASSCCALLQPASRRRPIAL